MTEHADGAVMALPSGTVTFLFTDVEGSTKLWAADKDAMSASLLLHDAILRCAWPGTTRTVWVYPREAEQRSGDHFGPVVNTVARMSGDTISGT